MAAAPLPPPLLNGAGGLMQAGPSYQPQPGGGGIGPNHPSHPHHQQWIYHQQHEMRDMRMLDMQNGGGGGAGMPMRVPARGGGDPRMQDSYSLAPNGMGTPGPSGMHPGAPQTPGGGMQGPPMMQLPPQQRPIPISRGSFSSVHGAPLGPGMPPQLQNGGPQPGPPPQQLGQPYRTVSQAGSGQGRASPGPGGGPRSLMSAAGMPDVMRTPQQGLSLSQERGMPPQHPAVQGAILAANG